MYISIYMPVQEEEIFIITGDPFVWYDWRQWRIIWFIYHLGNPYRRKGSTNQVSDDNLYIIYSVTHLSLVPHIYMRQWIGSALVQIMARRLFGAKPSSKPMLGYCQLDPQEQTYKWNTVLVKNRTFSLKKMRLKMSSAKWRPFCPGEDALTSR